MKVNNGVKFEVCLTIPMSEILSLNSFTQDMNSSSALQVTFSDEVETKPMDYTTENQNDTILQELLERDHQVRQLMEAKHFYEEVLSELCEEAGLFELDQNVVI